MAEVLPTAPTEAASAAPRDPCGGSLDKADGGAWTCTFYDEFTGSQLDRTKWLPQRSDVSGFTRGYECYLDDKDNVSVSFGSLRLTARKEPKPFDCGGTTMQYSSGMVSTYQLWSQMYGRYEIRARFPATKVNGLHEALWLWPADSNRYGKHPSSGEIDIVENYSASRTKVIPYVHYDTREPDPTITNNECYIADVSQWHKYVLEWSPAGMKVFYDGKLCLDHQLDPAEPLVAPQPYDQPFILIFTQALGTMGTPFSFQPGKTPLPATTQVDYVRVWQ